MKVLTVLLLSIFSLACAPNPLSVFEDYTNALRGAAANPKAKVLDCSSQQRVFLIKLPKGVTTIAASQPVNMSIEGDALGTMSKLIVTITSPRWIAIACTEYEHTAKVLVQIGVVK